MKNLKPKFSYVLTLTMILGMFWIVFVGLSSFDSNLPAWRLQFKELNPQCFSNEQHVYYRLFKQIIRKEASYKSKQDIEVMAVSLVAFSTNIPFFAGVIYTESLKPSKWKKGKRITPLRRWFHFTQRNDGGSPSYGAPKLKYRSIQLVCKLIGEKPPLSYKINMAKVEWQIKLMRWAAIYYDYLTKISNDPITAMAMYKYGPKGYRLYKRNNPYKEPFDVHGNAVAKAIKYLSMFSQYSIQGENLFNGSQSKVRDNNS